MPHCTTNIGWYSAKFLLAFSSILFVYIGFLKRDPVICVCGAYSRDWARRKAAGTLERPRDRCVCHRWQTKAFSCGCKRTISDSKLDQEETRPATGHKSCNCH